MTVREQIAEEAITIFNFGWDAHGHRGVLVEKNRVISTATDRILEIVFSDVVAGAMVEEMARAMGEIRARKLEPTAALLGEIIWQLRYDRAGEEQEKYAAAGLTGGQGE